MKMQERMLVELAGMGPKVAADLNVSCTRSADIWMARRLAASPYASSIAAAYTAAWITAISGSKHAAFCVPMFLHMVVSASPGRLLHGKRTSLSQLLVSDATTGTHGTLRWRLRVRGNTAVEFGVVPADHCSRHGTLHKVTRPRVRMSVCGVALGRPQRSASKLMSGCTNNIPQ